MRRADVYATKIITSFVNPPIPVRNYDWCAWYDGDEPNDCGQMSYGNGPTREAAVKDLVINYPRDEVA